MGELAGLTQVLTADLAVQHLEQVAITRMVDLPQRAVQHKVEVEEEDRAEL